MEKKEKTGGRLEWSRRGEQVARGHETMCADNHFYAFL